MRKAGLRPNPKGRKITGPFPEIVRHAIVHTVVNIGQFRHPGRADELKTLERYVRAGYLEKGKGGPFPAIKTVYARPGYPFAAARQHFIDEIMRLPNPRGLSVPERHQLKIARDTLKMNDVFARIMGGPSKDESREIIYRLTGTWPKEANPRGKLLGERDVRAAIAGLLKQGGFDGLAAEVVEGADPVKALTIRENQKLAEWLFGPMVSRGEKAWAQHELGGRVAAGVATMEGDWLTRFEGPTFKSVFTKVARLVVKTMPGSESARRAALYLAHGQITQANPGRKPTRGVRRRQPAARGRNTNPHIYVPVGSTSHGRADLGELDRLRDQLEDADHTRYRREYPGSPMEPDPVTLKERRDFYALDIGSSGAFMVRKADGAIFGIKGYGTPDYRKGIAFLGDITGYELLPWRFARGPFRTDMKSRTANPSRRLDSPAARAARTVRMFQDRGPVRLQTKRMKAPRALTSAAAELGKLEAVVYTTNKFDGRSRDYEHVFSDPKPSLVSDPEGKGLHIVGGKYGITPDGIIH
jgi:hypothetical protein